VLAANTWRHLASSHDAEFYVSENVLTYTKADFFCHESGGKLAQFKSEQEYKTVADINMPRMWIQGRRPCKDDSKFNCGSSDMDKSFVYEDGTNVGVFAPWAYQQPKFGNDETSIFLEYKLYACRPTVELLALCRREWKPLVTVDRVESFRRIRILRAGDRIYLRPHCGPRSSIIKDRSYTIVAQGKASGDSIRFTDVVGLYYSPRKWFGCKGVGHQCGYYKCPGSLTRYLRRFWRWDNRCAYEKFQIQSSKYKRTTRVVYEGDLVSLLRMGTKNGWLMLGSRAGVTLGTCPGSDGGWLKNTGCQCERFTMDAI